jgi:hypothetical protein
MNPFPRRNAAHRAAASLTLRSAVCLLLCGWQVGCQSSTPDEAGPSVVAPTPQPHRSTEIQLVDITADSGISFVHTHGGSGNQYIVEAVSAGVATFDFDGDGLIDIYFANGTPLRPEVVNGPAEDDSGPTDALYRNLGGGRFAEVTLQAGVGNRGYGLGVAIADYNNDGTPDILVTNYGPDVLYCNNGDGTFSDVSLQAGITDGNKMGAGACFLDIDADGCLDLYSANYCKFSFDTHPRRSIGGMLRAPSPLDFQPEPDSLFHNNGDGTFTDVSESSGIRAVAGRGMGVVAGDFDDDGDTDIFVANDVMANFLWRNDGRGHFENVAPFSGVAYGFLGKANGNMGVDCADYDLDGHFDFVITTYQAEMPVLHRNMGQGLFEEVSIQSNFGTETLPHVKWGVGFFDVNNDGLRDIFIANGHLEPEIHLIDRNTSYKVPNNLYLNEGQGKFRDVSQAAGSGLAVSASSRGTSFDDLDNDGDLDIVVLNAEDKPTVIRNDTPASHHWLQLTLRGTACNRDAVGAKVTVVAGDRSYVEEVRSGRGYQSHFGSRLHFGLGAASQVDKIEVRWPGGAVESWSRPPLDRHLIIVEGQPLPLPVPS